MDTYPHDGPDGDLPDLWVVSLNESAPAAPPTPVPIDSDEPTLSLFETADPLPSDAGFHPRLRRFDEAA